MKENPSDWIEKTESVSNIAANLWCVASFFINLLISGQFFIKIPIIKDPVELWEYILGVLVAWISSIVVGFYIYRATKNRQQIQILHCTQECLRAFKAEICSLEELQTVDLQNEIFLKFVREKAQNMCNGIEKVFRLAMHWNASVCIKYISQYNKANDITKLATLCRSVGTPENRLKNDFPIYASDNTDFSLILNGVVPRFCTHNLKLTISAFNKRNISYKNSSNAYTSKYNTVIVLPIGKSDSAYSNFEVVAFLCVDSRKSLNRAKFKSIEKMALIFAEALYPFFDYCMKIQNPTTIVNLEPSPKINV